MKTLTEQIEFLDALVANVPFGIFAFDISGIVTLFNQSGLDFLNLKGRLSDYIDSYILDILPQGLLYNTLLHCLKDGRESFFLDSIVIGSRYFHFIGEKLLDGMLVTISDVTISVESQEFSTQTLLLGQEMERQRLAEEIHNGIAPSLSLIKYKVEGLKKKYKNNGVSEKLSEVEKMVSTLHKDLRRVTHALMPSTLKDFGLISAVKNMIKEINQIEQIPFYFSTNLKDKDLSEIYELNLCKLAQELIHNAIQYSDSNEIQMILNKRDESIALNIYYDGVGVELSEIKTGIGLHNIKTRVKSLHGSIEIESNLGAGFYVRIDLPLKEKL